MLRGDVVAQVQLYIQKHIVRSLPCTHVHDCLALNRKQINYPHGVFDCIRANKVHMAGVRLLFWHWKPRHFQVCVEQQQQ